MRIARGIVSESAYKRRVFLVFEIWRRGALSGCPVRLGLRWCLQSGLLRCCAPRPPLAHHGTMGRATSPIFYSGRRRAGCAFWIEGAFARYWRDHPVHRFFDPCSPRLLQNGLKPVRAARSVAEMITWEQPFRFLGCGDGGLDNRQTFQNLPLEHHVVAGRGPRL